MVTFFVICLSAQTKLKHQVNAYIGKWRKVEGPQKIHGNYMHKRQRKHTVKEMLGESVIRHVLRNQQALVSLGTTTNQVHQSLVPDLANPRSLRLQNTTLLTQPLEFYTKDKQNTKLKEREAYHKLTRVRPGQLGEALNGD